MIKPVYFGNSKEDKFLLNYVNRISNFSDWVKNKLCEEFDVKIVGSEYEGKPVKDSMESKLVEKKVGINTDETIDKSDGNNINLNQWIL